MYPSIPRVCTGGIKLHVPLDILAYSVKIGNVVYQFFPVHDTIQFRLIITPYLCDGVFVYTN